GKPSDLTKVLVEAIEYPGFAFIQVLSGCVTFRPDQKEWKETVHPFINDVPTEDRIKAAQIIQADDGLATGVIYATPIPVWQPENIKSCEVAELEEEFCL
ncbi:MAG: 2-oxoacid:ferredoxin oxidoreductase subunit beta, partial [Candidatus Thiodiazotropha taylori]|nr:2-oxoacid:ferredoxin oxidoreductase subunit beta [Candidatus Thiodiazotropha taylori]MCW4325662.1 2-oxoacid:ferredoxin oxidoreductase subunit beta [Candidatus Thiodiazotropha taylori]